jgi:hypothetical protein
MNHSVLVPCRRRAALLAFGIVLSCIGSTVLAARGMNDYGKLQEVGEKLEHLRAESLPFYLDGEPEKALTALENAAKPYGWWGVLAIANMTWTMHPQQSREWHERAMRESREHPLAVLEVGLHDTRHGDCERALEMWKKTQRADMYGGYFPALGAYCLLRLGRDAEAVAEARKAEFGRHGGMAYARVLNELWGERPALVVYADAFAGYRAKRPDATLESVVRAAVDLPTDAGQRYDALLRVMTYAATATREPADASLSRDLTCLRPLFEAELAEGRAEAARDMARNAELAKAEAEGDYAKLSSMAAAEVDEKTSKNSNAARERWTTALERCGLMIGKHPPPTSGALLRLLVVEHQTRELADFKELLTRHGTTLRTRADSAAGDVAALEVLAALQSGAKDADGLRRSDELGWRRYRLPKFVASRVIAEILAADGRNTPESKRLLEEALRDFPDDALLLQLGLQNGLFEGEDRKSAVRRLLLAKHRAAQPISTFHFGPSASELISVWAAYVELIDKP